MEEKGKGLADFDETGVQEVYADAVNLEAGYYGTTILFGVARKEQKPRASVRVRMSPQMAKVLCLLLTQLVKNYEQEAGLITIPKELAREIGLERTEVY